MSNENEMTRTMDELLSAEFKSNEPGAAVIVTKDGVPVFRKGYGMANLELGVAIEPHMVFRLGSITKQFTAVCILMLMEQGKLDLHDEITKFLPDYPTHGHRITIEHLLTHTSGIKSYTGMTKWPEVIRNDYKVDQMIDLFSLQPMDFAPGQKWYYNNSGYFLLGVIVEKLSGLTYAEFLQKNIFEPLGMDHTYYDMPAPIIPGRVAGYSHSESGYTNADFLSMTQPYAAGSLASSVDDMAKWDAALSTEKLLKQSSLEKAWTSGKLNNGEETGYGYGWAVADLMGTRIITHGGGINGFITDGLRLPDDHVYVSILTNRGRLIPDMLTYQLAALAAGKPYQPPQAVSLPLETLQKYAAIYDFSTLNSEVPVDLIDGKLVGSLPMLPTSPLRPFSETEFFIDNSTYTLTFLFGEDGNVTGVRLGGMYGNGVVGKRTNKLLPSQRKEIVIEPVLMEQYCGEYQVAPGFTVVVLVEEGKLLTVAPGQPKMELHAENETVFFIKEAPLTMSFQKDASGRITGMVVEQGGQKMPAEKIK